jgi:hypothetical protein
MIDAPNHIGHPVGALLPQFTFITGPNGSGKTTLASHLFQSINGLQMFSFAEPIREAMLGMFYQGDLGIDLTNETLKACPVPCFSDRRHRDVLNALGDWYRSYFGPEAIGQWAAHRCELDAEYFDRFVFDDARRKADIEPIIREHGRDNCLLIRLSRPGTSLSGQSFVHDEGLELLCPSIELVNDGPIGDLLPKLQTTLEIERAIAS